MTCDLKQKTVLIFGASGFIGSSLAIYFESRYRIITQKIDDCSLELEKSISESDIIIHASGVSRSTSENDFYKINFQYSTQLLFLLAKEKNKLIIYFSSTHFHREDFYGFSKRYNEYIYSDDLLVRRNRVLIIRTPNVFGPRARPNNLSVVSTFCYNMAFSIPSTIDDPDKIIELIYIDDLAGILESYFKKSTKYGCKIVDPKGTYITIGELHTLIGKVARKEHFKADSQKLRSLVDKIRITFNSLSNYEK